MLLCHITLVTRRAAVKRLKTLRHPSVLTFVHSVETDKAVLLATEPVEPLQEHLEQLLDRGPKRDNYLAWGIFQVIFYSALKCCNKIYNVRFVGPCLSSTMTQS